MLFYYCCFLCLLAANIFLVFINIFFYVVKAFCFWMLLQKSTKYVSVINILYNLYTSSFFSLVLLIILFWLKQKFEILTPFGIWNIFFCFFGMVWYLGVLSFTGCWHLLYSYSHVVCWEGGGIHILFGYYVCVSLWHL